MARVKRRPFRSLRLERQRKDLVHHYLIHRFEGSEALEKQLRKAREGWEYEVVVNQIFTLPLK